MTTSLDMIRGRSNIVTMTNNSGGALIAGDVCIQDTTADENVTTTTSAASTVKVFIAAESIGIGASGKFYESGYCPFVNVSASATRGYFLFTHTVAKQATSASGYAAGAFGRVLKAGTSPSVIIYSATAQVAGGGTIGGSSGSADNAVIRADGTGGSTIQSSLATIDDSGGINIPTGQTYNINNSPHTHAASGAMIQLGTTTLGGDAATIAVDSIPSGYSAIKVIAWLRGTQAAASIWCNGLLNDDSGANYDLMQTTFISNTVSATTQNGASSFSVGTIPAASATAGMFGQVEITIAEYAGSARKVIRVDCISTYGTTNNTIFNLNSCAWRSTAAITKVSFVTADKFLAGSKMTVYGIT